MSGRATIARKSHILDLFIESEKPKQMEDPRH